MIRNVIARKYDESGWFRLLFFVAANAITQACIYLMIGLHLSEVVTGILIVTLVVGVALLFTFLVVPPVDQLYRSNVQMTKRGFIDSQIIITNTVSAENKPVIPQPRPGRRY